MLGTSFYNRLCEVKRLGELLDALRTVIVYGPRNAGKSELVRYFVAKRLGENIVHGVLVIDSRERRVQRHLGIGHDVIGLVEEVLSSATGLPRGLLGLLWELVNRVRKPLLLFIDEFHLLFGDNLSALRELEAVAGFLAKQGREIARLVVTVSEGFFATIDSLSRLQGYSVGYLLVEPLGIKEFRALYEEYRAKYGCRIGLDAFVSLAGTSPGYLIDLCPRSRELLIEWIAAELRRLGAVVDSVARAMGTTRDEAREVMARILGGKTVSGPAERVIGEKLVEANIAYPCLYLPKPVYLPQLPLYLVALEEKIEDDPEALLEARPRPLKRCTRSYC